MTDIGVNAATGQLTGSKDKVLEETYLGLNDYEPRPHARVTAIAKLSNGCWIKQNSFTDGLPPIGKAFAVNLSWVKENQPVCFTVKPNPKEVDGNLDQYIIEQDKARRVRCILDYRAEGLEQARYQCIEVGFEEKPDLFSDEIICAIADDQCLVIELILDPVTNRYVSRTGEVPIYSLNPTVFNSDLIMGRLYEVPEHTIGEQLEKVPWKMDQDLLDDLLKVLHRHDSEGPSKNERQNLISTFSRAKNIANELPDLVHLESWLSSFRERINAYVDAPLRIAETLLQIAPVKHQLEEARSRVENTLREELEPLVRSQLEANQQDLKQKLDTANNDLQGLLDDLNLKNDERSALENSLSGLKKELIRQIQRLNPVLGAGLEKEDFEQLVKSLRSALGAYAKRLSPRLPQTPPWSLVQASTSERISYSQLPERLNKVAREAGITSSSMQLLDIGVRSGALVILPQAQAETMVPAYARAVSRGDFVRVALGPSLLQLDDLWEHPAKEQPTGFTHAWLEAEMNPDQIQLVWLDGLQRTPMDLWLPSLIGTLHNEKRPSNFLIIASLEEKLLDSERYWKDLPEATFPISPETQACSMSQFYKFEKKMVTHLDWHSAANSLLDQEDFEDMIDRCDTHNYFTLKAEADLYLAMAKVNSSETPISEQLQKIAIPRNQGKQWLAKFNK